MEPADQIECLEWKKTENSARKRLVTGLHRPLTHHRLISSLSHTSLLIVLTSVTRISSDIINTYSAWAFNNINGAFKR